MALLGLSSMAPFRNVLGIAPVSLHKDDLHLVVVTVMDGAGRTWSAQAHVGNNPKSAATYVKLVDATGHVHPGLTAWFYADGVEVGACRFDNAYDYVNCKLDVSYDDHPVTVPPSSKNDSTVDFWRGCRGPMIRYGIQAPTPTGEDVDWTLLPSYTKDKQSLYDLAHASYAGGPADFSYNGLGVASMTKMGAGGERADIGYMSQWNVGFIVNQTADDWAIVRKADDWAGNWPIYYCDPATGKIIDRTVYPQANFMSPAQNSSYPDNPVVPYGGTYDGTALTPPPNLWRSSGCKFTPNGAHLTSFALLSAMLTKTARDKDHVSFWGNYPLMEIGPAYTESDGITHGAQRRFAWCLRNIFMAGYLSSYPTYFQNETARNLTIANALPKNAFGIVDTDAGYKGTGLAAGYRGIAPWMQNYLSMTLDAVSYKLPDWKPFAKYVAGLCLEWFNHPWVMMGTTYTLICKDPSGNLMTNFSQMLYYSLVGGNWTGEEIKALTSAASVQEAYNHVVAHYQKIGKPWPGKCVNNVSDFIQYDSSPSGYPAGFVAAVVAAHNAGADAKSALTYVQALPTKPEYTKNQKYHLVPRSQS